MDEVLDEVLKNIGVITLTIIILGIPVLFMLSIVFIWPIFVIVLLCTFTFVDLILLGTILHDFTKNS